MNRIAKIYKITAYLCDPNDVYESAEECFESMVAGSDVFCAAPVTGKTVSFEWDDKLIVNYDYCTPEDVEDFMEDAENCE